MANPLRKELQVAVSPELRLIVRVTFRNVSDKTAYVLKNQVSVFITSDGKDIPRIGPFVKRTAFTIDDYEEVASGAVTVRERDITDEFEWKDGKAHYQAEISSGYVDPVSGDQWDGPLIVFPFSWKSENN